MKLRSIHWSEHQMAQSWSFFCFFFFNKIASYFENHRVLVTYNTLSFLDDCTFIYSKQTFFFFSRKVYILIKYHYLSIIYPYWRSYVFVQFNFKNKMEKKVNRLKIDWTFCRDEMDATTFFSLKCMRQRVVSNVKVS